MKRYLACASVAAMLAAAPALAQTQDSETMRPAQPTLQAPESTQDRGVTTTPAPMPDRGATTSPPPMGAQPGAQPGATERTQMTETPAAVTLSLPANMRANNLIGARVYSSDDKHVGDVNDLVFDNEGKIDTIVIGVGGFLGIGKRSIGLSASELTVARDENERIRVSGKFTAENVSKLPEWSDPAAKAQ